MAYNLPNFNLAVSIWRGPQPVAGPAAVLTMGCLKQTNRQQVSFGGPTPVVNLTQSVIILLPAGTDVRDGRNVAAADVIECPRGTGAFYMVVGVWDSARGFANAHRVANCVPTAGFPVPYP